MGVKQKRSRFGEGLAREVMSSLGIKYVHESYIHVLMNLPCRGAMRKEALEIAAITNSRLSSEDNDKKFSYFLRSYMDEYTKWYEPTVPIERTTIAVSPSDF